MNGEKILDISWGTIFKIALAALGFYLIFLIRDILVWFLFALIFSILFNPVIDFLQSRKIPRVIGTPLVYFAIFGIFSFLIYLIIPLFISEIQQFSQILPQYFSKFSPPLSSLGIQAFENLENFTGAIEKTLEKMSSGIFNALFTLFGGIFSAFFIISIAIFLSLEEKAVERSLGLLFPKKYEGFILSLWEKCQKKVSGWFLIRILGSLFVGLLSYIAFLIFNVKYPFALALIAGIFNFIPIIGPLISGALIFLLVALDSLPKSTFVLISFILIQQIENNVFTPLLAKKFIGLPPVLVLIALVVGGKLWGIMGAILVIPLAGILFEFIRDLLKKRKEEKAEVL